MEKSCLNSDCVASLKKKNLMLLLCHFTFYNSPLVTVSKFSIYTYKCFLLVSEKTLGIALVILIIFPHFITFMRCTNLFIHYGIWIFLLMSYLCPQCVDSTAEVFLTNMQDSALNLETPPTFSASPLSVSGWVRYRSLSFWRGAALACVCRVLRR